MTCSGSTGGICRRRMPGWCVILRRTFDGGRMSEPGAAVTARALVNPGERIDMTKHIPCTCIDCGGEWMYVNRRTHGGGALPLRCSPCKALHVKALQRARVPAHTAQARRWRLDNPEKMKAARAAWEAENIDIRRRFRRRSKKLNPELNRSYASARKARLRGQLVVPFSAEQLRQRLSMFGGLCWMCGSPGTVVDHVKPISAGGAHALSNLRPACAHCNGSKGAKWPFPTSPSSFRGGQAAVIVNGPSIG